VKFKLSQLPPFFKLEKEKYKAFDKEKQKTQQKYKTKL